MRKIVVFNMVTLDGYYAGEDGNIDWHKVDDEFNTFAIEHTQEFGTLIFGATTYKLFEEYWPKALVDPATSEDDRKIAQIIEDMEKIVFSKTIKEVTWKNARVVHEINKAEVESWKQQAGKPMGIFGSGTIVQQFTNLGLIDEYRLMINPVILGSGKRMFEGVNAIHNLHLVSTKKFGNGNVLLCYD